MADAEFVKRAQERQVRGVVIGDQHTIRCEPETWKAMELLAQVHGTSVAEQWRAAAEARLLLHGLVVAEGEVVPTAAMAAAERRLGRPILVDPRPKIQGGGP